MSLGSTCAFDLPERLAAKAQAALIGEDEHHFNAIAASLEARSAELSVRLAELRRSPAGSGQTALQRDQEIHRLSGDLRLLRRYGLDLCLGRMVPADPTQEPVYIGRLGLSDEDGRRLLVDWRASAAEPFFAATHADPMGLASRRRYRWSAGRITDYWDEVFTVEGRAGHAALDDQSAFIASLGASRSPQMRDVLGTIAADQDAIIRAGARGALVVDGGPGTGKTVVALHRAAYLLYSDPRLGPGRGRVLFVGPHHPYLAYVADVLPSLGEEGVQTCTLADLVPEGAGELALEDDPRVAQLKADRRMVEAIEPAVGLYEEVPAQGQLIQTAAADVWISAQDWAEAFDAVELGTSHNEARDQVWAALLHLLVDRLEASSSDSDEDVNSAEDWDEDEWGGEQEQFDAYGLGADEDADPLPALRRSLDSDPELTQAFGKVWPLLDPTDLVADLWTVPAYLRRSAPWLTQEQADALQREDPRAWTASDLPLLDAARHRVGDPEAWRRRRQRQAAVAAERERMAQVVDHLIADDDSDLGVMSMLRGQDLQAALVDDATLPRVDPDLLAGPFAHVIVDEAQELTDAQWQMLLRRCPSRSFTIVGDRAQARHGFTEPWQERLRRVGIETVQLSSLRINYRTPAEVMAQAEPVIRAALPDANVPTSVRTSGIPIRHGRTVELDAILADWLTTHPEGVGCVIARETFTTPARVRSLTPQTAKGMEFDLVVLIDPESFGAGLSGAVDRYVAMTRATQQLVVLTD